MKRRDFVQKTAIAATTVGGTLASFSALGSILTKHKFDFMTQDHPNLTIINRFFGAYGANDLEEIKEVLSSEIKWHIPGDHPLSGTKTGIKEVMNFFKQLTKGSFQAAPIIMGVNDDYVIDCHRNWSNLEDEENLNAMSCLLWRIEGGKIVEVHNFPENQKDVDVFFNRLYG